jgi:hypothetical protein
LPDERKEVAIVKYLGLVKRENGSLIMPDTFLQVVDRNAYEAIQIGGDIILVSATLDRQRLSRITNLAARSIEEHRATLKGLAR